VLTCDNERTHRGKLRRDLEAVRSMNEIAMSLGRVFWGLLLLNLHVSFNHFSILPDFIGYLLVAVGLGGLTGLSAQFATARTYAWVLVPISLAAWPSRGELGFVVWLISLGLDCAMMWSLLGGIMDYSVARGRSDLAEHASHRRVAYVSLMGAVTFLVFVARGIGTPAVLLVVVTAVCLVVLFVMILHLIHRVKMELAM
jgi:hypothetical protein